MCFSISARYVHVCVHTCLYTVWCVGVCVCVCVCVGLLYTVLGAKTLEIALIWILCVSSNHNHVTNSPRRERLIHGAERRPSCMLLLYIHFILQELCSQNGFIHVPQKRHNTNGQKDFTVTGRDVARSHQCSRLETLRNIRNNQ